MRLLFENIIDNATITSLNGSLNYPPENLQDTVLKKRFQSSIDNDVLTINFAATSSVNSFYYGFTNAAFMRIRFYLGSDSLVKTVTVLNPTTAEDAYHFSEITADFAEIYIEGPEGVYLGGAGCGMSIIFPDPENRWNEPLEDNSIVSESLSGETENDYVESLRIYSWIFKDNTRESTNYYRGLYKDLGIGKPIWIDPFENDHDYIGPIYAKLTKNFNATKDGRRFNFYLDIKQAR